MNISISELKKAISQERLDAYKQDGVSDKTAVARCLFNIELCETLYPLISIFEVTLRNSIDESLSNFCTSPNWENILPFNANEKQSVQTALQSLKRKKRHYRMEDTRNRIAHHERIIHWKDLQKKHSDLLDLIKFLNTESYELAVKLDNFNKVFNAGFLYFEKELEIVN